MLHRLPTLFRPSCAHRWHAHSTTNSARPGPAAASSGSSLTQTAWIARILAQYQQLDILDITGMGRWRETGRETTRSGGDGGGGGGLRRRRVQRRPLVDYNAVVHGLRFPRRSLVLQCPRPPTALTHADPVWSFLPFARASFLLHWNGKKWKWCKLREITKISVRFHQN